MAIVGCRDLAGKYDVWQWNSLVIDIVSPKAFMNKFKLRYSGLTE
jgi:hypothetical protein